LAIGYGAGQGIQIGANGAGNAYNLLVSGAVRQVNNVQTSGAYGVPTIVATGRATGQTGANSNVSSYFVPSDGTFEVSANVLVTTNGTHSFTVTCAYQDEGNTARTLTLLFTLANGNTLTTIGAGSGAVPHHGIVQHIRCKGGNNIIIATPASGTYTGGVVYNVEGIIRQVA
jgi:hypothetical protein